MFLKFVVLGRAVGGDGPYKEAWLHAHRVADCDFGDCRAGDHCHFSSAQDSETGPGY